VYDVTTRQFRYTNAGHLPPFFVSDGQIRRLETGGLVVGLFDEFPYEQEILQVEPQSLLVAYSDGLTEPENVYGEQFGMRRLAEEVMRHRHAEPQRIAELLVSAAEEWASTPEQADDMTVLVARL
jgi:sigma-B regulation protein RsbU (phosphoserine phosphatase)